MEDTLCRDPLGEEGIHVGRQILDHRQISQRSDLYPIAASPLLHVRPTSPTRLPIDRHRARPAHPDPTRVAIRQRWIDLLLNPNHDIEDRLALLAGNLKALELAAGGVPSPNRDVESVGVRRQSLSPPRLLNRRGDYIDVFVDRNRKNVTQNVRKAISSARKTARFIPRTTRSYRRPASFRRREQPVLACDPAISISTTLAGSKVL